MEKEILDAIKEQTEAIKKLGIAIEKLNRNLERFIAKELTPPLGPAALNPDRVRYEDTQLLDARRTLPEAEYVLFHGKIMAGRAETLGQYSTAERLMKATRAKAAKLLRQAEG